MKNFLNLTYLKKAISGGALHVSAANFLSRVIQFGMSMLLVRMLSKDVFGAWSYSQNLYQMFLQFAALGVNTGLLQYASQKNDWHARAKYFNFSLKIGTLTNIVIAVIMYAVARFSQLPIAGSNDIFALMIFFPALYSIIEIGSSYLRSGHHNKQFSYLRLSFTFFIFLGTVVGAKFNVYGVVWGRYLAFILGIGLTAYYTVPLAKKGFFDIIEKSQAKGFIKFSFTAMLCNASAGLLSLLSAFILGLVVKDNGVIASYKSATIIPFALNFLPMSIMLYVYPYFVNKSTQRSSIKKYYVQLQRYMFIVNAFISLMIIIFAPFLIRLVFGSEYSDSIWPFRILMVGYFIVGTFRIPAGNVLATQFKLKINLYNSVLSGIISIPLNIWLITKYGSIGAAIATVVVYLISASISQYNLHKTLK